MINAQRMMILLSIVIFFLVLAIPLISANDYEFVLNVKATNMSWEWDYYNHSGVEIPLINTWFTSFSAEFEEISEYEQSEELNDSWLDMELEDGRQDYIGKYEFEIQLLDSSKNIINETTASSDFYLFSEPPVELEEDVLFFSFEKKNNAKYIRVFYNDSVILEQEFKSLLCNSNGKCENQYNENSSVYTISAVGEEPFVSDAIGDYYFYQDLGGYPAYYNKKGYYLYLSNTHPHRNWLIDRTFGDIIDPELSWSGESPNTNYAVGDYYGSSDLHVICSEAKVLTFENYLSCPGDCGYFVKDGLCNKAPKSMYTFNDHYCDFDCLNDAEGNGDCFSENCNDGIQNQDETFVDNGGVCSSEIKSLIGKSIWRRILNFLGFGR